MFQPLKLIKTKADACYFDNKDNYDLILHLEDDSQTISVYCIKHILIGLCTWFKTLFDFEKKNEIVVHVVDSFIAYDMLAKFHGIQSNSGKYDEKEFGAKLLAIMDFFNIETDNITIKNYLSDT